MKKHSITLKATAYHEAGHAVVALLLGSKVRKITIAPEQEARDAGTVGYITRTPLTRNSIEWDLSGPNRWRVEKDVECLLAGEIAQRQFAPHSVRRYHGSADRHAAVNLLSYISGPDTLHLYYKLLSRWTSNLLCNSFNWKIVQSLATTLLDEGTMSRKRVRQWYRDYREEEMVRLSASHVKEGRRNRPANPRR